MLDALRSGLPIERYARLNGLTPSALHRWKHKFVRRVDARAVAPGPQPAAPQPPTFATVSVATPPVPVSIPNVQAHRVEIVSRSC